MIRRLGWCAIWAIGVIVMAALIDQIWRLDFWPDITASPGTALIAAGHYAPAAAIFAVAGWLWQGPWRAIFARRKGAAISGRRAPMSVASRRLVQIAVIAVGLAVVLGLASLDPKALRWIATAFLWVLSLAVGENFGSRVGPFQTWQGCLARAAWTGFTAATLLCLTGLR